MPAILHELPLVEPVSLAQTKLHLKVDINADDDLISRLISAARQYVERATGQVLIEQTWRVYFNCWAQSGELILPVMPVSSVNFLKTYNNEDVASEIDPAHYFTDIASIPNKLVLRQSRSWVNPSRLVNGIEIEVIAGFGPLATDVPEPLRQAILLLTAHWYENRQAVCTGHPHKDFSASLSNLLQPYRVVRL